MQHEQDEGFTAFLDAAASHRLLTHSEELTLARRWRDQGDDAARHELAMHNIRLVVSIARKFTGRGLPLEDLVQAGLIGLDRATRKFDPERGFKCSTYFSWWIRQSTQRAVAAEGKTIRVPNQVATRKLQIDAELRENPGMSYTELAEKLKYTPAQIGQAMRTAEVVASLDRESTEVTQNLLDTLPDTYAEDPAEQFQGDFRQFDEVFKKLSDTQRSVIELHFGVGRRSGRGELTLSEVAEVLDIPLAAVQAAQREALTVLRDLI